MDNYTVSFTINLLPREFFYTVIMLAAGLAVGVYLYRSFYTMLGILDVFLKGFLIASYKKIRYYFGVGIKKLYGFFYWTKRAQLKRKMREGNSDEKMWALAERLKHTNHIHKY